MSMHVVFPSSVQPCLPRASEIRRQRDEICKLFDIAQLRGYSTIEIYKRFYRNPSVAQKRYLYGLHHVDECPSELLDFVRKLINPSGCERYD